MFGVSALGKSKKKAILRFMSQIEVSVDLKSTNFWHSVATPAPVPTQALLSSIFLPRRSLNGRPLGCFAEAATFKRFLSLITC